MNNAIELYDQAATRLDYVNEELNRPEEDVMTFSICHQTRGIMADLFGAYLVLKNKGTEGALHLEELRNRCCELDNGFETIDLTTMECHPGKLEGEEGYCMDLDRVRICLNVANNLKEIVGRHF